MIVTSYPRQLALTCVLLGGCGHSHELLLEDARHVSGCESIRYVTADDTGVYVVEGCGKTLRMRCQSEWNEPWCCREESAPPRTDCAAEDAPEATGTHKAMPGLNVPQ